MNTHLRRAGQIQLLHITLHAKHKGGINMTMQDELIKLIETIELSQFILETQLIEKEVL